MKIRKIIQLLKNKYIAVHIRRTDHVGLAKSHNRFTCDQDFINFLNNHKDYNIFIATDCGETQKKFKKIFNNRIKYMKIINMDGTNKRKTSFEDTIIDMFVCGFSSKFKGSDYSSYSNIIQLIYNENEKNNDSINKNQIFIKKCTNNI